MSFQNTSGSHASPTALTLRRPLVAPLLRFGRGDGNARGSTDGDGRGGFGDVGFVSSGESEWARITAGRDDRARVVFWYGSATDSSPSCFSLPLLHYRPLPLLLSLLLCRLRL